MLQLKGIDLQILARLAKEQHQLHIVRNQLDQVVECYTTPYQNKFTFNLENISKYSISDESVFQNLWEQGYLYLVTIIPYMDNEIYIYEIATVARMLWMAHTTSARDRTGRATEHMLQVLYALQQGQLIKVFEVNGSKMSMRYEIDGKRLHSKTFVNLVKERWIEPVDRPYNPDGNLRAWNWEWTISFTGRAVMQDAFSSPQMSATSTQDAEDRAHQAFMDQVTGDIVGLILEKLAEEPTRANVFDLDELLSQVKLSLNIKSTKQHHEIEDWARTRGLITGEEVRKRLSLNVQEFRTATKLGLIEWVHPPHSFPPPSVYKGKPFFDPEALHLSEEDRFMIARSTLLTREQAADRLGITVQEFERLKEDGIVKYADTYIVPGSRWRRYFYRQSDIDKLKSRLPKK